MSRAASSGKRIVSASFRRIFLPIAAVLLVAGCTQWRNIVGQEGASGKTAPYAVTEDEIARTLARMRPVRGNPASHYRLALHYQERGRHSEALKEFWKAVSIDPAYSDAFVGMGVSYDATGKHGKAQEAFRMVLKSDPESHLALNNLGYSYLLSGRYSEAAEVLEKAVALNNENRRYHNNLGRSYFELEDYEKAHAQFRLGMGDAGAEYTMGRFLYERKMYRESARRFAEAHALDPKMTMAKKGLEASTAMLEIEEEEILADAQGGESVPSATSRQPSQPKKTVPPSASRPSDMPGMTAVGAVDLSTLQVPEEPETQEMDRAVVARGKSAVSLLPSARGRLETPSLQASASHAFTGKTTVTAAKVEGVNISEVEPKTKTAHPLSGAKAEAGKGKENVQAGAGRPARELKDIKIVAVQQEVVLNVRSIEGNEESPSVEAAANSGVQKPVVTAGEKYPHRAAAVSSKATYQKSKVNTASPAHADASPNHPGRTPANATLQGMNPGNAIPAVIVAEEKKGAARPEVPASQGELVARGMVERAPEDPNGAGREGQETAIGESNRSVEIAAGKANGHSETDDTVKGHVKASIHDDPFILVRCHVKQDAGAAVTVLQYMRLSDYLETLLVEVSDSMGDEDLAKGMGRHLRSRGFRNVAMGPGAEGELKRTKIYYSEQYLQPAYHIAMQIPGFQEMEAMKGNNGGEAKVIVMVGRDMVQHASLLKGSESYAWSGRR